MIIVMSGAAGIQTYHYTRDRIGHVQDQLVGVLKKYFDINPEKLLESYGTTKENLSEDTFCRICSKLGASAFITDPEYAAGREDMLWGNIVDKESGEMISFAITATTPVSAALQLLLNEGIIGPYEVLDSEFKDKCLQFSFVQGLAHAIGKILSVESPSQYIDFVKDQ